ncbi:MAG: sodium/proline symporter, partial [Spirochaetaceae bacterium]|nr:sodium/proline symporter [Spirochaetaceae bacterium]
MISHILAFVIYLGFMIMIGVMYAKKNNSSSDFFLGGRKVGPWMTALSAEASDMSGWLLMGLPGLAYLGGMKEAFWTALGLVIGTYLNWLIVAKPLRKCTIAFGDSITIPEFLTNRFKDKSKVLSTVSVIFIILFFTIYTASGFVACAKLFNSVFGLPYHVGLVLGTIVILLYTILGGYLAVCATDFIQGTLMFIACIVAAAVMVVVLGGPGEAMASVAAFSEREISGEFGEAMQGKFLANQNYGIVPIISALAWGLGYFGMPHILIRFMGIRSNKEVAL